MRINDNRGTALLLQPRQFFRVLVAAIVAVDLFVCVLGGLSLGESYTQHQRRAEVTAQNLSQVVEGKLSSDFEKIDLALQSVVDDGERQLAARGTLDGPALSLVLQRLQARLPEVNALRVADAAGIVRHGVPGVGETVVSIADREYFLRQRDKPAAGLVVVNPLFTRIDRQWAIPVSRRINRPDGSFAGVAYANVSVTHINETFSNINVGPSGSVALRSVDGALVARHPMLNSRLSEIGTKVFFPEAQEMIRSGKNEGTVISRYPADNVQRTVSFRRIQAYPFFVLIGLAVDDYLQDWRVEVAKTGSASGLFVLMSILAGWWINRAWQRTQAQRLLLEQQAQQIHADYLALEQAGLKTKKLAQAIEQSPVSVVICDVAGTIEYVNPKFSEASGYAAAEAIGQTPRLLRSGVTSVEVYRDLWATILDGRRWQGELLNRKKNGELFWEHTRISPLRGEDGRISHFITVKEDISERRNAEALLKKLSLAVEHSPSSVIITNKTGVIEYVNQKFVEVSGYSSSDVLGKTPRLLKSGLTSEEIYKSLWATISSGKEWSGQLQNRCKTGELLWENERISPITDEHGAITHFVALKEDVTTRKQVEDVLRLRNSAVEASSNGIILIDAQGPERPIIYSNRAFEKMTGYSGGEVAGRSLASFLACDHDVALAEFTSMALQQAEERRSVVRSRRRDGTVFWNEFAITAVRNEGGSITHYVGVLNDVTERITYEQQLAHQANHDSLTGLANRNLLTDRIEQAIVNARRYGHWAALLLVDLDHFKYINDSLGHATGDLIVKDVAELLRSCAREGDTVARLGGDEFVLVLYHVDGEQDVVRVMDRIVETISAPVRIEGREHHLTCSVGASVFPRDADSAEHLLRNADTAMYRAKDLGRNGYSFYTADMNVRMMERLTLEGQLRQALVNEEFVLHYQPQIDLSSGKIVGAEALIRWQSPSLGLVPPGKFINIAEETGLIIAIGDWVLAEACRQIRRWQLAGLPHVRVAINISAMQFRQKDFTRTVATRLQENHVAASSLELELTESMLMHDVENALVVMQGLKAMDVHLSLDDFGTGYSSLSYLKRFPIDVLKLDQSFVRDILVDPDDATIARSVITLGHHLGLKVVAEGVESEAQLVFMQSNGCDLVQGYYFSRPVAADTFSMLLGKGLS